MSLKRFLVFWVAASCGFGTTIAVAAELSQSAMPAPIAASLPAKDWTGAYVGAHVGGAWNDTGGYSTNCGAACTAARTTIGGSVGGLQAGYNYQVGQGVVGVEADLNAAALRGSYAATDGIDEVTSKVDHYGTLTAKIGVSSGQALLYAKVGAAWTHNLHGNYDTVEQATFSTNYWKLGWTLGGGLEYAFTPSWSVKMEYDVIDTGKKPTTFYAASGAFFTATMHQRIRMSLLGLNYKF